MARWRTLDIAPAYEVSDAGAVRRRLPGTSTRPGRMLTPYRRRDGYMQVTLRHEGRSLPRLIHRLVAVAFHGPAPSPVHEVAHFDGDRANNVAGNLRWCRHTENQGDMIRHGRSNRGERHFNAKLTDDRVREARARIQKRGDLAALSREWSINPQTLHNAVRGKKWRHVS